MRFAPAAWLWPALLTVLVLFAASRRHSIHMAAITQIRYAHSEGRAYCDKKTAEGKTSKEALRALKRRISDALYRRLRADARCLPTHMPMDD